MNDYISILKKDLLNVIDNLVKSNIVNKTFNKDNLTIDYLSKSKQGDVSTNLFILLNSQLNEKNQDLRKNIMSNWNTIDTSSISYQGICIIQY